MKSKKVTPVEAIDLLNDEESIHTFRNPGGILIGADWKKKDLIGLINRSDEIQITGELARNMKHGLVLEDKNGLLFIETNEIKLNIFDPLSKTGE